MYFCCFRVRPVACSARRARKSLNTQVWGARWRPAAGFRVHIDKRHELYSPSFYGGIPIYFQYVFRGPCSVCKRLVTLQISFIRCLVDPVPYFDDDSVSLFFLHLLYLCTDSAFISSPSPSSRRPGGQSCLPSPSTARLSTLICCILPPFHRDYPCPYG